MDGEFDKEINDGGWGPTGPWLTLQAQVDTTLKALGTTCNQGEREKKVNKAKQKMEQLIKEKGRTPEYRGPLGKWLWEETTKATVKRDEMAEQGKRANALQKPKWKKKGDEWEKERQGWSELTLCWHSLRHLHLKQPHDKKVITSDTTTRPPPYAPPTQGQYPTFYINKGILEIGEGEDEDHQSTYNGTPPSMHSSIRETGSVTSQNRHRATLPHTPPPTAPADEGGLDPFSDRRHRDQNMRVEEERYERMVEEQEKRAQREIESASRRRKQLELEQARELATDREIEILRRTLREKEQDERTGPRKNTDKVSMIAAGQWEDELEEVKVQLDLEGEWEEELEAESVQDRCISTIRNELINSTGKALETAADLTENLRRRKSERIARRQELTKIHQFPVFQAPLITTSGQRDRYRPFAIGDIQAMVDKLPPLTDGGNLWLSKLDTLTAGQTLALGDFRAVGARCMTPGDMRTIEIDAGIVRLPDDTPFVIHSTKIGKAIRDKFPLPNSAAMPKMR